MKQLLFTLIVVSSFISFGSEQSDKKVKLRGLKAPASENEFAPYIPKLKPWGFYGAQIKSPHYVRYLYGLWARNRPELIQGAGIISGFVVARNRQIKSEI